MTWAALSRHRHPHVSLATAGTSRTQAYQSGNWWSDAVWRGRRRSDRELRYALRVRDEASGFSVRSPTTCPISCRTGAARRRLPLRQNYLGIHGADDGRNAARDDGSAACRRAARRTASAWRRCCRGRPQQYEQVRDFNGRTLHLWASSCRTFTDGMVRGFFLLATDVSSIKQAK